MKGQAKKIEIKDDDFEYSEDGFDKESPSKQPAQKPQTNQPKQAETKVPEKARPTTGQQPSAAKYTVNETPERGNVPARPQKQQPAAEAKQPAKKNPIKDLVQEAKPTKEAEPETSEIKDWSEVVASNDTNKFIIIKFMRKGFTSLSAEELASTMISPDFTKDFENATKENWVANYQFKVVERLNQCNFNLKWKTRPNNSGVGYMANFFDLCKRGDTGGILKFFREKYKPEQDILDEIDPSSHKTGLHFAVEEGQTQVVEYLLKKGAKVDARDKLLRTPLHIACLKGQSVIAYTLIEFKCDTFERDISGRIAMHFAVCCGDVAASLSLITILSKDSMDLVHMTDHSGRTPLHYAVFTEGSKQIKVVEMLINLGANVNAADQERRTALHTAAEEGKANLIPILIQNGASPALKDYQSNTPFEIAKNEHIRELIIVNAPNWNYKPSQNALDALAVEGNKKKIQVVANLPAGDFYEPFEHAQPRKRLPKLNKKKEEKTETGVEFVCGCQCQPAQVVPPEELCAVCRPLGPSNEWLTQKKTTLPYNIRNYQAKLVELLRRTQEFGVTSFQHVRKPYLFTGSWMEYVRTQEDLNLQIAGCRSYEAVMKVFNILFPYEKPLPRGEGDELGLAAAYMDNIKYDPKEDLKDCHPDLLRARLQQETKVAVTEAVKENRVEDINDLLTMQQQMTALVTANEMALVNIQAKDDEIVRLKKELQNRRGPVQNHQDATKMIALEEQIIRLQDIVDRAQNENNTLQRRIEQLTMDLEQPRGPSTLEVKLKEEVIQLKKAKALLEEQLLHEKERNVQLRAKAGAAFMEALDDPLLATTEGKKRDVIYCPEDDEALVRLLQAIDRKGGANFEQRLLDSGDMNKYISIVQFDGLLKQLGTAQTDYTPLQRIAGFYEIQGNVKKIKVNSIMERVYNRKSMRQEVEEQTLRHIASYIEKRQGFTVEKLFAMFDEGDNDGMLTEEELVTGLQTIKINVNQQLKRILLAIFDHNKDGLVSKDEFFGAISKYTKKAPIASADITGDVMTNQEKEEVAKMYNEEIREKAVYEQNADDLDDTSAMEMRKAQMIELIKNKQMPVDKIRGEIIVRLDNFANLPEIPGKEIMLCRLKQAFFDDVGAEQARKAVTIFAKGFNREQSCFDPPLRFIIKELKNVNKNVCWDIITLELYLTDANGPQAQQIQNAQFIGECNIKWKHCLDEDKKNEWQDQQVWLIDPRKKAKVPVDGQINIATVYREAGSSGSIFNADGTEKEKPAKYGKFQADPAPKFDLAKQQEAGSAGQLDVYPKTFDCPGGMYTAGEFRIRIRLNNSAPVTSDAGKATGSMIKWMDCRVVAVSSTAVDHQLIVELVMIQGQNEEVIASGIVDPAKLQQIYSMVEGAKKPFKMQMKSGGVEASLNIAIEFKPKQADTQEVAFDPSAEVLKPAVMETETRPINPGQNMQNKIKMPVDFPVDEDQFPE